MPLRAPRLICLLVLLFLAVATTLPSRALGASGTSDVAECTTVDGILAQDAVWTLAGSPYCVTASILVRAGVTLAIEAGVTVLFGQGEAMRIDGTLVARGTASAPITFTSSQATPANGDWGHILFSGTSTDASYDDSGDFKVARYCGT
jgi:hypothetical protein